MKWGWGMDKRQEIQQQREYQVIKANDLIRKSKHDLTTQELKLLNYIISKIKPTDSELQEYTISIKEFCQVCGISTHQGNNYEDIRQAAKKLRDKSFWVAIDSDTEVLLSWVQKVRVNKSKGKITIKLDDDLQKYLINQITNYTQFSLIYTLPMKSSYSIRIYELIKSYANTSKVKVFALDELKALLGVKDCYKEYKDFRIKVLDKATKEINEFTDIKIEWKPIKEGKAVKKIEFKIKKCDSWESIIATANIQDKIDGQLTIEDYYK